VKFAISLLMLVLLAGVAFAISPVTTQPGRWAFPKGIFIGNDTAKNRIADTVTVDVDYDFASGTIVCTDSAAASAPGVLAGDPCFVGIGPRDGGVQIVTGNSVFTCFSDATDTAKLRHCPVGTAANPVDAGYVLRFISSQ
jgi:hypothetical protein